MVYLLLFGESGEFWIKLSLFTMWVETGPVGPVAKSEDWGKGISSVSTRRFVTALINGAKLALFWQSNYGLRGTVVLPVWIAFSN